MQQLKPLPSKRERIERIYFYCIIGFVILAILAMASSCNPKSYIETRHYRYLYSHSKAEKEAIRNNYLFERSKHIDNLQIKQK